MCLFALFAIVAKAQNDVTALWDWEHNSPLGICASTNFEGKTGDLKSNVDGVVLHVDATNGKLNAEKNNYAQFNQGTILQVPVKSVNDVVTVKSYPGQYKFTVGGVAATSDVTTYNVKSKDLEKGYVEVIATGGSYLYSVQVKFISNIQEKELYSTNFSEWGDYETAAKEEETVVKWNTKYSHEEISFSIFNTQIGASNFNVGKFPDWTGGMLMAAKSDNPYIITSKLASVTKVHFIHGATGGNRGWKLWAKGDGDADWVVLSESVANPAAGCEVTCDVNRTNCQLKFTNLTTDQNAYLLQLDIYGNVDMSLTPSLGTFSYNNETYHAADIFEETSAGLLTTTIHCRLWRIL